MVAIQRRARRWKPICVIEEPLLRLVSVDLLRGDLTHLAAFDFAKDSSPGSRHGHRVRIVPPESKARGKASVDASRIRGAA